VTDDIASPRLVTCLGRTLKTHERIGDDDSVQRIARSPRRLVIRSGSSPVDSTDVSPQTLQEAKPKAGAPETKVSGGSPTGIEAQKSKLQAFAVEPPFFRPTYLSKKAAATTPTKINRGERKGTNDTWARSGRNVAITRWRDESLRRVEPHERRRTGSAEGQNSVRLGREA